jgi:hypothetical protein
MLARYLHRDQLVWQSSGKDSLEHNWAKFAAQTNSIDRQLRFINDDLSRKQIELYQKQVQLVKEFHQLDSF